MGNSKKEQAIRAKDMALEKMAKQDFSGAKKLALLARKLDPNVEDIVHMILVCDVHSRSGPRMAPQEGGGGDDDRDWYRVLDLDPKADIDSIRHRCNKMAFNLHPDKNRFPGAMEAFRLVCRAAAVLTDDGRRRSDSGFSGFATFQDFSPSKMQDSGFAKFRDGPGSFADLQDLGFAKFRNLVGAFDKGSLKSIDGGEESKLQNSGFAGFQNGPGPFGQGVLNNVEYGDGNAGSAKLQDSGFAAFQNGFGPFDRGCLSNLKDGDGNANVQGLGFATFQNGSIPFDRVFSSNLKDGAGNVEVHDSSFAKNIQNGPLPFDNCSMNNLKDGTRNAKLQESGFTKHGNGSGVFDPGSVNKIKDGAGNAKFQDSGFTTFQNGPGPTDHGSLNKLKETFVAQGPTAARVIPNLRYSESELSDFEKGREKECFRTGQIWAIYDTLDAMPRFYALINNAVSFDNFKVHITWLEPCPDNEMEKQWLYKGFPASCGRFKLGETEEINDPAIFSHLVNSAEKDIESGSTVYRVCPRKGETWAVFKNWKMEWCLDQEMQRFDTGFEFDFVEITSDYCDDSGVSVRFLCKIKGFSTIFSRLNGEEEVKIMAKDKFGFSHRVLSFRMKSPNGGSRFFELDPASLPEYLNSFVSSEISTFSKILN